MSTNFVAPYVPVITPVLVGDILYTAARKASALKMAGQGLSPSETTEFLSLLNSMVNGWKIENLLMIYFIRYIFHLSRGKKDYSVAPGQDFDMERPERIQRAGFILNEGTETEGELQMHVCQSYQEYVAEVAKNVTSQIPLLLYYQPSSPYGTATFWPVPSVDNFPITIYNRAVLQEFQSADDNVYAPDGFREMLEFNLAWRIHQNPPYNTRPMDPTVVSQAEYYKARVKAMQVMPILTSPDIAVTRRNGSYCGGMPKTWTPYG